MKFRIITFLHLGFIVLFACELRSDIEISPKIFDLGIVTQGDEFSAEFEIINNSSTPVLINKTSSDCGCIQTKFSSVVLGPNGSLPMEVNLKFVDNLPFINYEIEIATSIGNAKCNIVATIEKNINLFPNKLRINYNPLFGTEYIVKIRSDDSDNKIDPQIIGITNKQYEDNFRIVESRNKKEFDLILNISESKIVSLENINFDVYIKDKLSNSFSILNVGLTKDVPFVKFNKSKNLGLLKEGVSKNFSMEITLLKNEGHYTELVLGENSLTEMLEDNIKLEKNYSDLWELQLNLEENNVSKLINGDDKILIPIIAISSKNDEINLNIPIKFSRMRSNNLCCGISEQNNIQ